MQTLVVMVGLPGSGKDYYINSLNDGDSPNDIILSTDNILEDIADDLGSTYNEVFKTHYKEAERIMETMIQNSLNHHGFVIWNQTNLTKKKRKKILNRFRKFDRKVCVYIKIDEEVHKQRLAYREQTQGKFISDEVIEKMRSTLEEPSMEEGFDEIFYIDNSDFEFKLIQKYDR